MIERNMEKLQSPDWPKMELFQKGLDIKKGERDVQEKI